MSLPHRIAAGAIVVRDDRILLVRHSDPAGGTFLVAPGGGVLEDESVADAAVRETFEETGVRVVPGPVLLIEDVLATRFKMCKVWLGCDILAGEVSATEGARREGILGPGGFGARSWTRRRCTPGSSPRAHGRRSGRASTGPRSHPRDGRASDRGRREGMGSA
jgi:hypothetical protein